MVCKALLIADSATVDSVSGSMNIVNAVNRIPVAVVPTVLPRMTLVGVFERTPEETADSYPIKIAISVNDKPWAEGDFGITFAGQTHATFRVGISNLTVTQPGQLRIVAKYEGVILQTVDVPIYLSGERKIEPSLGLGEQSV